MKPARALILIAAFALASGAMSPVWAETGAPKAPDAPAQSEPPQSPATPAERAACPPGQAGSPTLGRAQSPETLSEQLARSGGVICPPAGVDPQIANPPPEGGRTPVIPPPGTPGGDQSIQPK